MNKSNVECNCKNLGKCSFGVSEPGRPGEGTGLEYELNSETIYHV